VAWAWRQRVVRGVADGPDRRFQALADCTRRDAVLQVRRSRPGRRVADLSSPNSTITRGQAARLLYAAAGSPNVRGAAWAHGLSDVPRTLDAAVRFAVHDPDGNGPQSAIAAAFDDGTFRPSIGLERATFIRQLHRLRSSTA
jgi:hypothetical protein